MRTLYVNEEALDRYYERTFPELGQEIWSYAKRQTIDTAIEDWSVTHVGSMEGHDTILLTSLEDEPSDVDLLPGTSILLTPGPNLIQSRRIPRSSYKEWDGVPVSQHYIYRHVRTLPYMDERKAKAFAKQGFDSKNISRTVKEQLKDDVDFTCLRPKTVNTNIPVVRTSEERNYHLVTDQNAQEVIDYINRSKRLSIDTETTAVPGWDYFRKKVKGKAVLPRWDQPVGVSFSNAVGSGYYVATNHPVPVGVMDALGRAVEDPALDKYGHNIKFDMDKVRLGYGWKLRGRIHDTQTLGWLAQGRRFQMGELGLKKMALEILGFKMIDIIDLIGKESQWHDFNDIPPEYIADYAAADADTPLRIADVLLEIVEADNLQRAYRIEQDVTPILHEMEWRGVRVNRQAAYELHQEFLLDLEEAQWQLDQMVGRSVNIGASAQLSKLIFQERGYRILDPKWKTKTGVSTDSKKVMRPLMMAYPQDPFLLQIQSVRERTSLATGVLVDLFNLQHPETGRIHGSYNQTNADTGRLSASNPNNMAIPSRSKLGRKIRYVYDADPGNVIIVADKSQIEPRIIVHLSDEDKLREVYKTVGADLYRRLGSSVYSKSEAAIDDEERQAMKIGWLALQYLGSAYTVVLNSMNPMADPPFQMSIPVAEKIIDGIFKSFPRLKQWMNNSIAFTFENGYAVTEIGNRRYLPKINSYDQGMYDEACRQAVNHPVQGLAANLFKLGLIELAKQGLIPVNLVHDEYIFEEDEKNAEEIKHVIKRTLESIYPLSVPILVEPGHGPTWGHAK